MKILFSLFVVLLFAIGVGFLIHEDPGYVMVSYQHWVIATSIWVAIAMLFLAFFVFYFLMRMITNIFLIPKALARRRKFLNEEKYRKYMMLGLSELGNHNNEKAEKYFLKLKKQALMSEEEFNQIKKLLM